MKREMKREMKGDEEEEEIVIERKVKDSSKRMYHNLLSKWFIK